jgi:hypothetical protein
MARFPRKGSIHKLDLVLFDRMQDNSAPYDGHTVRVVQPFGCPRNGTMNMGYVEDASTGEFIGLVCRNSLTPAR